MQQYHKTIQCVYVSQTCCWYNGSNITRSLFLIGLLFLLFCVLVVMISAVMRYISWHIPCLVVHVSHCIPSFFQHSCSHPCHTLFHVAREPLPLLQLLIKIQFYTLNSAAKKGWEMHSNNVYNPTQIHTHTATLAHSTVYMYRTKSASWEVNHVVHTKAMIPTFYYFIQRISYSI